MNTHRKEYPIHGNPNEICSIETLFFFFFSEIIIGVTPPPPGLPDKVQFYC